MTKIKTPKLEEEGPKSLPLRFDSIVRTDQGTLKIGIELSDEQVQYLLEVAVRTLIGIGALALPPVVHIPSQEEVDGFENAFDNMEDWKKKHAH